MGLTQIQLDNVQIDYGIVYINYGVAGERKLGPTRGGGEFKVTGKIRDIEWDGSRGKEVGMQVVDEVTAVLTCTILDMSMDNLAMKLPWCDYTAGVVTAKKANFGVLIPNSAYFTNATMFCRTTSGTYKKITLYNAMDESDFDLKAKPKGEGEIGLDIYAHWSCLDDSINLCKVEDVASISGDVTPPTCVTVPVDLATAVVKASALTAVFSEDIKQSDINQNNFILVKATDGSIVAGTLTYTPSTKTALFQPTTALAATTGYVWNIVNVRDLAGNIMAPNTTEFTTGA